ncbi:MAG: ATP-binding protein [Vulcanimicrobiota bacterium]
MKDFETLKSRISLITWIFFILSIIAFIIIPTPVKSKIFIYVTLSLLLIINITFSIPRIRTKLNSQVFFGMIAIFASLVAALLVYSGQVRQMAESVQNPFFPILLLPVIIVSFYFNSKETYGMVTIIIMIDLLVSMFQMKHINRTPSDALNYSMFVRIAMYNIVAYFIRSTVEDREGSFKQRREELENMVKMLEARNKEVNEELNKFKDSSGEESPTYKQYRKKSLLLNFYKTLSKEIDLTTILSTTIEKLREITYLKAISVFLYNSERSQLYLAASDGNYTEEMKISLRADINIPGIVAQTGKTLHIQDIDTDPRFDRIKHSAKFKTALYIPIYIKNEVYGVLAIWNDNKVELKEQEIMLIEAICRASARSIKNAELYKQLDTRLNFIVTLWETSKNLTSSLDLSSSWEKVLQEVLKTTSYVFQAEKGIYFQYKPLEKTLTPYILHNLKQNVRDDFNIQIKKGEVILSDFLRSDFQIRNMDKDLRFTNYSKVIKEENLQSVLWTPLMGRNRIVGALALFTTHPRTWTHEQLQWLDIFANMLSITLENVSLLHDLYSEKNQLQTLIDTVPEGVLTTDCEGKILTWNRSAEQITRYKPVEVLGSHCRTLLKCQNIDNKLCGDTCLINNAVKSGIAGDSGMEEVFIIDKEGKKVPVFLTAAPIYGDEEVICGAIMVFRDITQEKEIENMKEEFLATITHDLKSPLASIMSYTELLKHPKLEATDTQKNFLDSILRSSKTLQILINNILESTRMESGELKINRNDFILKQLLEDIRNMFNPMLNSKSLELEINCRDDIVVNGDYEKLSEVFINLLSNAIKFTPGNGNITIEVTGKNEDDVVIKVIDTGKGIPEEEIENIFSKFSQVKGEKKGTGLGLYICKKILEKHDRAIKVKSTVGKGSEFKFTLPAGTTPPRKLIKENE